MNRRPHRPFAMAIIAATIGVALTWPAVAAAATPSAPPQPSAADKSEEKEPAHRVLLLGATIFGTVAAPNATYDIPWQEPFLLGRGATELDRNFLKEIFKPVDREEFLKTVPATTAP